MHPDHIERWNRLHDAHAALTPGRERATRGVLMLTVATMAVELVVGYATGSMALVADGWHMSSHALAMALAWLVYVASRSPRFRAKMSFGTGKLSALGGYTSALLLWLVASWMAWQSFDRLRNPVASDFGPALYTAVGGLVVNLLSAWILGDDHDHDLEGAPSTPDHNHRAAFVHVLADALTSVLAIGALLGAKYVGWNALDPVMGLVGAALVLWWSGGLLRNAGRTLLDFTPSRAVELAVCDTITRNYDADVADVHIWEFGPGQLACQLSIIAHEHLEPDSVRATLSGIPHLTHVTVEVNRCREH